jgi:hypothetical protein
MDLSDEGVCGWCMRDDDNEFMLQIEKTLTGEEHDKTILHELYHCYQHMMNIPRCEMCSYMSEEINLERYNKRTLDTLENRG